MQSAPTEKFLARILIFGAAFTTVFLISGSVTDPVNAPKMLVIAAVGCSAFLVVILTSLKSRLVEFKVPIFILTFFTVFMMFSSIASKAPLSQLLYGSYGRNNGFLTYLFLSLILISALCIKLHQNFRIVITSLLVAGGINLAYNFWVIAFGDFVGWQNPYGNILGTLGNPNFIGAFLGIIFAVLLAVAIDNRSSKFMRLSTAFLLPLCGFEIVESHAIQGRVVAAAGSAIVIFFLLRSKFSSWIVSLYSLVVLVIGGFALAGALQKGPLTEFVYKYSVSLRGQYWLAGWNTGQSHPFTGVGMDTFGDWYRRMRDIHALTVPGVNTVVNAAHNVPLDIFAFGGWPLFISYLALVAYTGWTIFKVIQRKKDFDVVFVVLVSGWAGYQLQSIISINQIGLAVWGWLFSGLIIAYERSLKIDTSGAKLSEPSNLKKSSARKSLLPPLVPMYATFGALIGLVLALPPLTADAKWRKAQVERSLPSLESSMSHSLFNPQNSTKYLNNIQTLEQSNLLDLSRKYALEAVKWNPDSFELWKVLYLINKSTPEEKAEALKNMKRLDPLNPDVTAR